MDNYKIDKMRAELITACGGKKAFRKTHEEVMKATQGQPFRLLTLSANVNEEPPTKRSMALLCYHEIAEGSDRPNLTSGDTISIAQMVKQKEKSE